MVRKQHINKEVKHSTLKKNDNKENIRCKNKTKKTTVVSGTNKVQYRSTTCDNGEEPSNRREPGLKSPPIVYKSPRIVARNCYAIEAFSNVDSKR